MVTAAVNSTNVNMTEIYDQMSQASSDTRKTAADRRLLHQDKAITKTEESISEKRSWLSKMGKGALFGLICGIVGGLANAAGFIPGIGGTVAKVVDGVMDMMKKINPWEQTARQSEIKAEELEKEAHIAEKYETLAQQQEQAAKENRQKMMNDLEKVLMNNQAAQEATLRV